MVLGAWCAAATQITGSTQLLGRIQYTRGTCTLTGSNIPGALCGRGQPNLKFKWVSYNLVQHHTCKASADVW
jgi:hypothetical protein